MDLRYPMAFQAWQQRGIQCRRGPGGRERFSFARVGMDFDSSGEGRIKKMSICWYCYWGWAKSVFNIYRDALFKLKKRGSSESPMHFGPAHIVWEDEDWNSVDWCLENFDKHRSDYSDSELRVVRWSLMKLKRLSPEERDPEPEEYDGESPEKFPPEVEVEFPHIARIMIEECLN